MKIAILAKAPFPGFAKTRLIAMLGPRGAAAAHRRLVKHTLQTCVQAELGPCMLWVTDPHPFFIRHTRTSKITMIRQPTGDLGQRMAAAFQHCPGPTLLVGTDCPVLTPQTLKHCAKLLAHNDLITCPTEDGGFALIGAAHPETLPFNKLFKHIDWGTDSVLSQFETRVRAVNLPYQRGPRLWDVDEPEDHERWLSLAGHGENDNSDHIK